MSELPGNVAKRYRELAREEPPAALDAAILAASRRAVARPSLARRWAAPVSIAAVLVLAFGLTLEMQHDKRSEPVPVEKSSPPAAAPVTPPAADVSAPRSAPEKVAPALEAFAPAPKPLRSPAPQLLQKKEEKRADLERVEIPAAALAPAAPPPPAAAESASANRAEPFAGARAKTLAASLEDELERIAKLRAQGRHEEADKALAEFRGKHPDYRIPDAIWERVKPRPD